jgi:hypothetical protein
LAADINPGAGSSTPDDLAATDTTLYFSANDGVNGTELWTLSNPTVGGAGAPAGFSALNAGTAAQSGAAALEVQPLPSPPQGQGGNEDVSHQVGDQAFSFNVCAVNELSIQAGMPRIPGFHWAPWRIGRANVNNSQDRPWGRNEESGSEHELFSAGPQLFALNLPLSPNNSLPLVGKAGEGGSLRLLRHPNEPASSFALTSATRSPNSLGASDNLQLIWHDLEGRPFCEVTYSRPANRTFPFAKSFRGSH